MLDLSFSFKMISCVKTDLNEFLRFQKALEPFENAGLKTWGYAIWVKVCYLLMLSICDIKK